MSDHWIHIICEDPRHVPGEAQIQAASEAFQRIAPGVEVESETLDQVEFFDCGANFESVACPSCGTTIDMDWWQERMDEDYNDGFQLRDYEVPCCSQRHSLHQLEYQWPHGFGRFHLAVVNANVGKLRKKHIAELELALGTKIRVIYQAL